MRAFVGCTLVLAAVANAATAATAESALCDVCAVRLATGTSSAQLPHPTPYECTQVAMGAVGRALFKNEFAFAVATCVVGSDGRAACLVCCRVTTAWCGGPTDQPTGLHGCAASSEPGRGLGSEQPVLPVGAEGGRGHCDSQRYVECWPAPLQPGSRQLNRTGWHFAGTDCMQQCFERPGYLERVRRAPIGGTSLKFLPASERETMALLVVILRCSRTMHKPRNLSFRFATLEVSLTTEGAHLSPHPHPVFQQLNVSTLCPPPQCGRPLQS